MTYYNYATIYYLDGVPYTMIDVKYISELRFLNSYLRYTFLKLLCLVSKSLVSIFFVSKIEISEEFLKTEI